MQVSSHLIPPEPPARITSRPRYHAPVCSKVAMVVATQSRDGMVNFDDLLTGVCNAPATEAHVASLKTRTLGSTGTSGIDFGQYDAPLGQWRSDRSGCARRDYDASLRAGAPHVDQGQAETWKHGDVSSIDPRAEGARARAAGLAAEDNPYLWPPGWAEQWAAGFEGEVR